MKSDLLTIQHNNALSTTLRWIVTASIIIVLSTSFSGTSAFAAEKERKIGDKATQKTPAISQKVYKKLTEAQELIENKQYNEGLAVIRELQLKEAKLSDYEKAQMWNMFAYTYYLQERYKDSISAYEKLVAIPDIPEGLVTSVLNTLAQLYFTIEEYRNALDAANRLFKIVDKPSDKMYLLIAQAHYQLKQYKQALKPMKTVINAVRERRENPKENWLLLLRVLYYELKDYKNMITTLHEMLELYPKERYLRTLTAAYSETGNRKKQLAVMQAMFEKNYLTVDRELLNMASLYLLYEAPYKAAKIIEYGFNKKIIEQNTKNLKLLSQAWYQARENKKSLPPLKRAADISGSGELYVRLAQSYMNLERWGETIDALQSALTRGKLKRVDTANIMLGIALLNKKRFEPAIHAFQKAAKDKRSRKEAKQWIAFVDSEKQRDKIMAGITN